MKRSSKASGSRSTSSGGMNEPHAPCHSGVRLNASRHHARQRSRVRSGMARPASADAAEFEPACRLEFRTTTNAKYTRRPRKRTDTAVVRLRHVPQQKLKR